MKGQKPLEESSFRGDSCALVHIGLATLSWMCGSSQIVNLTKCHVRYHEFVLTKVNIYNQLFTQKIMFLYLMCTAMRFIYAIE